MNSSDLASIQGKALASFKAFVGTLHPLTEEELARLDHLVSVKILAPGEQVTTIGETPRYFGIVLSGLLTSTFVSAEGVEVVRHFWAEGDLWGHYIDYLRKRPSKAAIIALEPTTLLSLEFMELDRLAETSHGWCMAVRRAAERIMLDWEERSLDFASLDSAERYRTFATKHAKLLLRLKKQAIAAYLGIRPESLSRLLKAKN